MWVALRVSKHLLLQKHRPQGLASIGWHLHTPESEHLLKFYRLGSSLALSLTFPLLPPWIWCPFYFVHLSSLPSSENQDLVMHRGNQKENRGRPDPPSKKHILSESFKNKNYLDWFFFLIKLKTRIHLGKFRQDRIEFLANSFFFSSLRNTPQNPALKPFCNGCDFQIKHLLISSSYMFGNPIMATY